MAMIALLHARVVTFFGDMGRGTVEYHPYRSARVVPWLFKMERSTPLAQLLEHYLAWSVSHHKDNHCVYSVQINGYTSNVERVPMLHFWFADSSLYVGTEIIITERGY